MDGRYLTYYAKNSQGYTYTAVKPVHVTYDYPYPDVEGKDRIATSATAAKDAWPTGCSKAVFCSGDDYYDALSADYLAGALSCPVILLSPHTKYNTSAKAAVKALKVTYGYAVGGSLTKAMLTSAGITRYSRVTSAHDAASVSVGVLSYTLAHHLAKSPTSVMLSSSLGFADALGASAYIANKHLNIPVLFTQGRDSATKAASKIASLKTVKSLYVLGSTKVISSKAAKEAKSTYIRLWGTNRQQTAASVFATFAPKVASYNGSGHVTSVAVASSEAFPDALGAGAAQAHMGGVVLICPPTKVGPWTYRELKGGTITISGSAKRYTTSDLIPYLTNFEFYGHDTIASKVRYTISSYVR
jgi:putative cell wall-binding protein